jgi:hypothetical protein
MRWLPLVLVATALVAAPAAQAADSLTAPTALTLNTPFSESGANFTVENGEQNTTAPFTQQCDSGHDVGAAHTGWYTIQGTGDQLVATTEGSSFDTSMFVYSGSASGNLVGCNDDDGGGVTSIVTFGSTAGTTYYVQVGVACNGQAGSQCSAAPAAGQISVRVNGPQQQQQPPPAQQPPAQNAPPAQNSPPAQNAGPAGPAKPAALPVLRPEVATTVVFGRNFTRFAKLNLGGVAAGSTITVTCSPKKKHGCPFSSKALAVTSAKTIGLASLLKNAKLRRNAILVVRVTRPGYVGSVVTFTMRNRRSPLRTTQCLAPGATKPGACP